MFFFNGLTEQPEIDTQHFTLRPCVTADADDIYAIFSDSKVMRYWDEAAWQQESKSHKYIEDAEKGFKERRYFNWGIADKASNRIIGTVNFHECSSEHLSLAVGFALNRDHWGQGVVSEVLPVMIKFAFEQLNINRIQAVADPDNDGSIRALTRAGFQQEGCTRQSFIYPGTSVACDELLFGLLKQEWLEQ